jgi:hypothetical protein
MVTRSDVAIFGMLLSFAETPCSITGPANRAHWAEV